MEKWKNGKMENGKWKINYSCILGLKFKIKRSLKI
jgi:hypothetical protein